MHARTSTLLKQSSMFLILFWSLSRFFDLFGVFWSFFCIFLHFFCNLFDIFIWKFQETHTIFHAGIDGDKCVIRRLYVVTQNEVIMHKQSTFLFWPYCAKKSKLWPWFFWNFQISQNRDFFRYLGLSCFPKLVKHFFFQLLCYAFETITDYAASFYRNTYQIWNRLPSTCV